MDDAETDAEDDYDYLDELSTNKMRAFLLAWELGGAEIRSESSSYFVACAGAPTFYYLTQEAFRLLVDAICGKFLGDFLDSIGRKKEVKIIDLYARMETKEGFVEYKRALDAVREYRVENDTNPWHPGHEFSESQGIEIRKQAEIILIEHSNVLKVLQDTPLKQINLIELLEELRCYSRAELKKRIVDRLPK